MKRDDELFAEYFNAGQQEAFEILAQRHAPMVFGVCRRMIGEHHAAEDAAQAVFLALLKNGRALRNQQCLAGWLYRTATQTALHHLRAQAALRRREREAGTMNDPKNDESVWQALSCKLDEALTALPEKYRQAVVLRYLEGHSRASAAESLGVPEKTLETWLYRGLARLRAKLNGQGVAVAAPLLAQLLESHQAAAPAGLIQNITQLAAPAAVAGAAAAGAAKTAAAPHIQALAESTLRSLYWAKVKLAAAGVVAACAVTAVAAVPLVGSGKGAPPAPIEKAMSGEAPVETKTGGGPLAETKAEGKPEIVQAGEHLIINGAGYFRQFTEFALMRLSSELLRAEGEKLFGARLKELERTVKRLVKNPEPDWTKTDWRDVASYHIPSIQTGDDSAAVSLLPSIPPAAGWMNPDFDDASFLRQKLGLLNPVTPQWGAARERSSVHRKALYVRTFFDVPDPAAAGDLSLKVVYRGGARVFVNGQEIARGDLPPGEIGGESWGADYPAEAYTAKPEELPKKPGFGVWIGDLRCPFEMAAADWRNPDPNIKLAYGGASITRSGWERLMGLRDRSLGPVRVPAKLLRKGRNVLAMEIRSSRYNPVVVIGAGDGKSRNWAEGGANGNVIWDHLRLVDLELRSSAKSVPVCIQRPAGLQVWAEDMHNRLYDRDYNPAGWPVGSLRFVGAQNGVYGAQIGVSTDKELKGLKAACGDLAGENGAKIPAAAIRVQYMAGNGLDEMSRLGWFRSFDNVKDVFCPMTNVPLYRYSNGPDVYGTLPADKKAAATAKVEYLKTFHYFDQIGDSPPETVPANSCQPLWLSLKVPAGTPPGKYKGAVTVQTGGQAPIEIPLEAEVIGWRVPDPQEFQMHVQAEQSPYGVAKAYKCELWSDRHFELMETSFQQLARTGNDWLFVPVLLYSELGNREDGGPVKWTRKKDGALAFDFTLLDRYLALARKHQGKPRGVCFLVMHGCGSPSHAVNILDEASGKLEAVELGSAQAATRGPYWRTFATAVCSHMKTLGLEDVIYWGHGFDDTFDPALVGLLAEVAPQVGWAAGGHVRRPDDTFRCVSAAMGPDLTPQSMNGWKNPYLYLLTPRTGGSVICVEGISTPFTWRVMCDRAIFCGMNGLGRMGADYFDMTWWDGFRGGGYNLVGRPCVQTLWPGPKGVETSARVEAMLEGIQEAEARIFLEQTLERKTLPPELAAEAEAVLNAHYRSTLYIAAGGVDFSTMDVHGDWQGRSRALYHAAAKAAQHIGLDVDRNAFGQSKVDSFAGSKDGKVEQRVLGDAIDLPALGKTRLSLKLRNWTAQPREFKAESGAPWIVPEKAGGSVSGQQELGIVLDGATLKDGSDAEGVLTIIDAASGTKYPVRVAVKVSKAMEYHTVQTVKYVTGGGSGARGSHEVKFVVQPVFNVPVGGAETKEYVLYNRTAAKQAFKFESSHDWVALEPAAGEIPAQSSLPVKIVVRPKDTAHAYYEPVLTLGAAGGAVKEEYRIKTYVIPAHTPPPVPAGDPVYLCDGEPGLVKSHMELGLAGKDAKRPGQGVAAPVHHRTRSFGENLNQMPAAGRSDKEWSRYPYKIGSKTFTYGLWVFPHHETVYTVEGKGFVAFAAEVGFFEKFAKQEVANKGALVNFELYVDGKLRAQSGIMGVNDEARLLVADLQGAKELKLVTRRDNLSTDETCLATWGDPRFIKAK